MSNCRKRKINQCSVGGKVCHCCQYRKGGCPFDDDDDDVDCLNGNCRHFRLGGCYSCKYYYGRFGKLNEQEVEQWFDRGCEVWCPSSLWCNKRKRLSRKRKKRLKKYGLFSKED